MDWEVICQAGILNSDSGGRALHALRSLLPSHNFQEVTHLLVLMHLMAEGHFRVDAVSGTPAFSYLGDVAVGFKGRDDVMSGPLGDAQRKGDLAGGDSWLLGDQTEHQGVIGQKFPSRHAGTSWAYLASLGSTNFGEKVANHLTNF